MASISQNYKNSRRVSEKFVIVAAPRTGSNLLCTLLNSHPDVLCHHEIFNPRGIRYSLDWRQKGLHLGDIRERNARPQEFLQRVLKMRQGHASVGFKWTLGQDEEILEDVLQDINTTKILLLRNNRIKTFVSQRIAELLDQWEVYDADLLSAKRPMVHIDLEELRQHIKINNAFSERIEKYLVETEQRWAKVFYEDLQKEKFHSYILRFLGLRISRLKSPSIKQNPTDLRKLVSNYTLLLDELEGDQLYSDLLDARH